MLDLRSQAHKLVSRFCELFMLREAEQRAKAYTPEQNTRLAWLHDAAVERLRAARDLRDATRIGAAGAVYRETLLVLPRALLLAWDPERAVDGLDARAAWQELENRLLLPQPDASFRDQKGRRVQAFREAQALAVEQNPLILDRLAAADAVRRLDAAHETSIRLLQQIEPRSVQAIRRSRVVRLTLAGVSMVVAVALFVVWVATAKNVALGKPANASSYFPGSGNAGTLVNGEIESPFGSATAREQSAWFWVDLLSDHEIGRVVVYNRSDSFGRETTPFSVELSDDGKTFREAARLGGKSTPAERWVIQLHGQVARYVRLRKLDARGLALSEIEVYGSKR